jgi:tetraprenyl-beta-curcumene synthase
MHLLVSCVIPLASHTYAPAYPSLKQLWTLLLAAGRELFWGLPRVAGEVHAWRARALTVPDAPLRDDALCSLKCKRANADGAALFSILCSRRDRRLLRLLVAYELMSDYLDTTSERGAHLGIENGRQLHLALVDALCLENSISAYYCHNSWQDDRGYLRALVGGCRRDCHALVSYSCLRHLTVRAARLAQVQGLNHELDLQLREAGLKEWAATQLRGDWRGLRLGRDLSWFELAGAASAWLTVLALLALAANRGCGEPDGVEVYAAYFPWISLTATVLDGYVDTVEDLASGSHNYLANYGTPTAAATRAVDLVTRSTATVGRLRRGDRHSLILACMIAMYLSKDSARVAETSATTAMLVRAGGSLTRLLVPILRLWRVAYRQQSV